jgi:hypothetical protein
MPSSIIIGLSIGFTITTFSFPFLSPFPSPSSVTSGSLLRPNLLFSVMGVSGALLFSTIIGSIKSLDFTSFIAFPFLIDSSFLISSLG